MVGLDCTDTSGAATTYEWDVLNRLTRIDNPDGTFAAYRYDAQGRRIEKEVNGSITRYVYDGPDIALEFDGVNVLIARYSHGEATDQPLAMTRSAESFFYHTDHLGSVRLVTDTAGAVANSYDYDAFGNLEATSFETVSNPFGFTARERDAESGLMFYRARYYDPQVGRFVSQDPIGFEAGDANHYRYVLNRPTTGTDPSGLVLSTVGDKGTATSGAGGYAALGTRLGCTFSNLAGIVGAVASVATGEIVGIAENVVGIGSCSGAQVSVIVRSSSLKAPIQVVKAFVSLPRATLLNTVRNGKLKNIVSSLFRKGARIGNGSTADAYVFERITGILLSKTGHYQKMVNSAAALRNILQKGILSYRDQKIASALLRDIERALANF